MHEGYSNWECVHKVKWLVFFELCPPMAPSLLRLWRERRNETNALILHIPMYHNLQIFHC